MGTDAVDSGFLLLCLMLSLNCIGVYVSLWWGLLRYIQSLV